MNSSTPANGSPTQALIKRLLAAKLTQSEISRRTGIPQPRISRWAAGDVAAGADDALKLQSLVVEIDQAGAAGAPDRGLVDRRAEEQPVDLVDRRLVGQGAS